MIHFDPVIVKKKQIQGLYTNMLKSFWMITKKKMVITGAGPSQTSRRSPSELLNSSLVKQLQRLLVTYKRVIYILDYDVVPIKIKPRS